MRPADACRRRGDRLLTLGAVRPLRQLVAGVQAATVPILMYHAIADDVDDGVHPYLRTVTTPATFARHMALLAARGTRVVGLMEARRLLRAAPPTAGAPGQAVVLTFDDGLRDFATSAWPILQEFGFGATVFVATDFVGRDFLNGRPCLDAPQIRRLSSQGVEFGSHSASHRRLVELPRGEVLRSRGVLQELLGRGVDLFSYPYRFPQEDRVFMANLERLLAACGYDVGVTTVIGRARARDAAWAWPRLPVNECDDASLLSAKLDGHYDWLRTLQGARKRLRAWMQPAGATP
jgi:peptidoglycan/xylan/chitin deacetylase (PgdA/CDA1 family)